WHHDLAWDMPGYRGELHEGFPWDLLRRPWPGVRHVTVSAAQRARIAQLFGLAEQEIAVVPPGVDAASFFRWTATTRELVRRFRLLEAGPILLLPVRLTPRKNIELALHVLASLRRISGEDARLIVTGPPGPHNPANRAYFQRLLELREHLELGAAAHVLYEIGVTPDDATVADLYGLADILLFPSTQEGFGIPILEAGLARLPVFCSDIPPFREAGREDVDRFSTEDPPEAIARRIWERLCSDSTARLRYRVRREFLWETIVRLKVLPLLEGSL
ncbi:MAG: glycosyltransferase, partial [Chloroflexia bacterium]